MHHEWKIILIFNMEGGSLSFLVTGWGGRGSSSPGQEEHGPLAGAPGSGDEGTAEKKQLNIPIRVLGQSWHGKHPSQVPSVARKNL